MRRYLLVVIASLAAVFSYAQPKFSVPHGLYDVKSLTVEITAAEGAQVYYTLDGSTPTTASTLYTAPLTINKTTIVRAIEVSDAVVSSVSTASYIFVNSVLSQSNAPEGYPAEWGDYTQTWGTAIADYEMDSEMTGNSQLRPKIVEGLKQIPILSIVSDKENFFSHEQDEETGGIYIFTGPPVGDPTGHGWTRPASVELFGGPAMVTIGEGSTLQSHDLSTSCGVRLHGGHGRLAEKNPKHSFRLVFKEKYGPKTLKYPVFGNNNPAKFDQLVLRCHFGNAWQHWSESNREKAQYTRDVWARRMQRKLGGTAVDALYVHLFLNGMYWGLYNIAERIDDQYGKDHLGGKKEDIDVVKLEEDEGYHIEASEGTLDAWQLMNDIVARADDDECYAQLDTLLDIDNFIDYMLINQYAGNTDWNHHNWYAIRRHNSDSVMSQGFRFICWDTEIIFEDVNTNIASGAASSSKEGVVCTIYRHLLRNPSFAKRYQRRAKELLHGDGLLGEASVVAVWDSLYHTIDKALYCEAARWGDYRRDVQPQPNGYGSRRVFTVDDAYMHERNRLINDYFPYRTDRVLGDILAYVAIDDFEVPDSWQPFAASLFHQWNATDADAKVVNDNPGAELNQNKNVNSGGVVAGFTSVAYNLFADVSKYDQLVIRGTGGRLRIIANRLTDHGDYKEVVVELNQWDSHWNASLQAFVVSLSELRECNMKQSGIVRHDDFVHINALKVESGTVNVTGMWLTPGVETVVASAIKEHEADGPVINLQGMRVMKPARSGGLYIRNGRIIMIKR